MAGIALTVFWRTGGEKVISFRNVDVKFNLGTPLETHALRDVSLDVKEGQFLTVIGSNGAGKSTVLNALAGGAPIFGGSLSVDGKDVTHLPVHRRAKIVSRVFQDPRVGTCADLTLLENFAIARARTQPRRFRPAVSPDMKDELKDRLSLLGLGLENRINDLVGQLSGGQRQALSLIMASTGHSKVLLLDEHTAALDPETASYLMSLTSQLVAQTAMTTLMVTHSMQQALDYGDRIVMFHRGKIVLDVDGTERAALTVNDLLSLFKKASGEELCDDVLLLG